MNKTLLLNCVALSLVSNITCAAHPEVKLSGKQYGVILGESRVIYPLNSKGVSISVNNPQDYPVLIQARVLNENKTGTAPFIVTPPLFRLDSTQQSSLRIVQTETNFPNDKESLQWLCVKGIPPKNDDLWAGSAGGASAEVGISLQIAIDNCIKMMLRPNGLKGNPSQFSGDIEWMVDRGKLTASNPTPYYMNLGKIKFGGKEVSPHFIPPKGKWTFDIPRGAGNQGSVAWQVINDQGGLGQEYSKKITF